MLVAVNENGYRIGESHHRSKLTDKQVDLARELHDAGVMGYDRLSRLFNVSRTCIKRVVKCETRWQIAAKFKKVDK